MDATGIPALDTALVWGGALSVLTAVVTVAWKVLRGLLHLFRRVNQVIDDWAGQEERPGVPRRLGVMERVGGIEDRVGGIEDRVGGIEDRFTRVEHELHPNSGESLRDAVDLANDRLALLLPGLPDPAPDPPSGSPSAT